MVQKWGALSLIGSGKSFLDVARRPNLTMDDARAIERDCPSVALVDVWLGATGFSQSRVYYGHEKTKQLAVIGATENWSAVNFAKLELRAAVHLGGSRASAAGRRCLATRPGSRCSRTSIPSARRANRLDAVYGHRRAGPASEPGNFSSGVDDFVIIPYGTHEKLFGKVLKGSAKITASSFNPAVFRTAMIAVVPREGSARRRDWREVEAVMRIRHGLKLDQANDFDLATQDAVLKVWDQISQATFLGLVVISSIALMVGGIGVMAIMMISVTERTREIGVRKALGARRREILWQFLVEAVFLTSAGGLIGILFGSSIGMHHPLADELPRLAPVVVVRHRHRLLRRASASSSACSPPSRRREWIRSRRCATSSRPNRLRQLPQPISTNTANASTIWPARSIRRWERRDWCDPAETRRSRTARR